MLDEAEGVEYAGELMSYVYGETAERWASKGKGKGKRQKGKGKAKGKDSLLGKGSGKNSKGFGIYGTGTYADHRRALQEAHTSRGFNGGKGEVQRRLRFRTSRTAADAISATRLATGVEIALSDDEHLPTRARGPDLLDQDQALEDRADLLLTCSS